MVRICGQKITVVNKTFFVSRLTNFYINSSNIPDPHSLVIIEDLKTSAYVPFDVADATDSSPRSASTRGDISSRNGQAGGSRQPRWCRGDSGGGREAAGESRLDANEVGPRAVQSAVTQVLILEFFIPARR